MIWILLTVSWVWLGLGFYFVVKNIGAIMFGTPRTEWYHLVLMAPVLLLFYIWQKIRQIMMKVCNENTEI